MNDAKSAPAPECPHNDHSHTLIWAFIYMSLFFPQCVDCSGERDKTKNELHDQAGEIVRLKTKLSLEEDSSRKKLHEQEMEIESLRSRISALEGRR